MSLLGSVSPLPSPLAGKGPQTRTRRGGEAEQNKLADLIRDPELRAAFLRAYRAWEKRQERTTT